MDLILWIYTVMFFFGIYFLLIFLILYLRNRKLMNFYVKPTKFPLISILVPAYNEENTIENTINALLKVDYPKNKKEIIVINDGSTDRTAEIVGRMMKKYKEIRLLNKKNSGKANSLNQGIKIARGELLAVVDSDSSPMKDSFMKMIGHFENPKVGAVTSRVLVKNKKNFIEKFQAFDYAVIAWGRKILDFIGAVYVTNGPLSIYRTSVVRKLGGFDPKNLTEDIEITWNILSHGYETRMSYSAIVYTSVPSKLKTWVNQRVRWNIGGIQTINKYKKYVFRGTNAFGYFVVSYVSMAFFLAVIGFLLVARWVGMKLYYYFFSLPLIFQGYNPFDFIHFNFSITILTILGAIFLGLSFIYYMFILKDVNLKRKGILTTIIYNFIYRPLYLIPLLVALYRLKKGDVRWFTK